MSRAKPHPTLPIDLGGGAAILAACAMIGLFGVRPIARLKQEQTDRTSQAALLGEQTDGIDAQIKSIRDEIVETSQKIEQRRLTLMPRHDINARLALIIDHATEHNLEILAIKPGDYADGEFNGQIPIDMRFSGTLPDFVRYLHDMRLGSADLVVEKLDLQAAPEGAGVTAHILADWLTRAD